MVPELANPVISSAPNVDSLQCEFAVPAPPDASTGTAVAQLKVPPPRMQPAIPPAPVNATVGVLKPVSKPSRVQKVPNPTTCNISCVITSCRLPPLERLARSSASNSITP